MYYSHNPCLIFIIWFYLGSLIGTCLYNIFIYIINTQNETTKLIIYFTIGVIIIFIILLKCYYKKTKINYSIVYKQKLIEIAETYSNDRWYPNNPYLTLMFIKINNEDIALLVEIKLKENNKTTIEQLWTETEQELKDTINNFCKIKNELKNKRRNEMNDLENQIKEIKKQSLINNLKQQGKRKAPIVKHDDLISFV